MKTCMKIGVFTFLLFLANGVLWAGDISGGVTATKTTLNTYVADTLARAEDVNENFAQVRNAVNDNDTRLDSLASNAAIKDGTVQTNLNADMLDGLHEASFFNLNQAETVSGIPAFNGGTSGSTAPFSVDSTTAVTNLNADLLDGVHESSFFQLGQSEAVTGIPAFNGGTSGSTAPFSVDSTTAVTNLNADMLDGNNATAFAAANHTHSTLPLAMGTIDTNGSIIKAWNVSSCTWNATNSRYEIAITGYSYTLWYEATMVTVIGAGNYSVGIDAMSSKLLVIISDDAGKPVQKRFAFITWDIP